MLKAFVAVLVLALGACVDSSLKLCGVEELCGEGSHCEGSNCVVDIVCGDNKLQPGEQCDELEEGIISLSSSCEALGYYGGQLGCNPTDCSFVRTPCELVGTCGDGILQADFGEQCDGEALVAGLACTDFGNFDGGVLTCNPATCLVETSSCESFGLERRFRGAELAAALIAAPETVMTGVWADDEFTAISSPTGALIFRNRTKVELPAMLSDETFTVAIGHVVNGRLVIWLLSNKRAMFFDTTTEVWTDSMPDSWGIDPKEAAVRDGLLYVIAENPQLVKRFRNGQWEQLPYTQLQDSTRIWDSASGFYVHASSGCRELRKFDEAEQDWQFVPLLIGESTCESGIDHMGNNWVSQQGRLSGPPGFFLFGSASARLVFTPELEVAAFDGLVIPIKTDNLQTAIPAPVPFETRFVAGSTAHPVVAGNAGVFALRDSGWSSLHTIASTASPRLFASEVTGLAVASSYEGVGDSRSSLVSRLWGKTDLVDEGASGQWTQVLSRANGHRLLISVHHELYVVFPFSRPSPPRLSNVRRMWQHSTATGEVVAVGDGFVAVSSDETLADFLVTKSTFDISEVEGNSWDNLFAIAGTAIVHWNGSTVTQVANAGVPLLRLWVSPDDDVWAISKDRIWHLDNGALVAIQYVGGDNFTAISGLTSTDIFVGGQRSSQNQFSGLLRFKDGRWTEVRLRGDHETVLDLVRTSAGLEVIALPENESIRWEWTSLRLSRD